MSAPDGVEKRAAGEAVVHRRGGSNHFVDRATASGRQRPADHGDEAGAGGDGVAPGAGDREREVADARRRVGRRDRRRVEAGDAQHGEARRRIPSGELGVERHAVVAAHVQTVFTAERAHRRQDDVVAVHEAAGRPPPALHLHDGWSRRRDRVGELVGEAGEKIVRHAAIVTETRMPRITQTGSARTGHPPAHPAVPAVCV